MATGIMPETMECKWYSICPIKRYYENGLIEKRWILTFCRGKQHCIRYDMEERGERHPDWMLPDGTVDERLRHA